MLAREHGNLEAVCDALIAALATRCEDDITVILARIPPDRPLTEAAEMYPQRQHFL